MHGQNHIKFDASYSLYSVPLQVPKSLLYILLTVHLVTNSC